MPKKVKPEGTENESGQPSKRSKNRNAQERFNAWASEISDIVGRRYTELKDADQLAAAMQVQELHKKILSGDCSMSIEEIRQAIEGGGE